MKKYKKIVISLCVSLVILGVFQVIYSNITKNNEVTVKIVTKDVYKGEKIPESIIQTVKIERKNDMEKYQNIDISGKVASKNITSGKILENEDLTNDNVENVDESYEYVTIDIKNASDGLAYQLKKGDKVSLYYTLKDKEINTVSFSENVTSNIEKVKTIRLFEELEVIGLFDVSGNEIKEIGQFSNIMFRVDKNDAMTIANIKNEGTFSVALIK